MGMLKSSKGFNIMRKVDQLLVAISQFEQAVNYQPGHDDHETRLQKAKRAMKTGLQRTGQAAKVGAQSVGRGVAQTARDLAHKEKETFKSQLLR